MGHGLCVNRFRALWSGKRQAVAPGLRDALIVLRSSVPACVPFPGHLLVKGEPEIWGLRGKVKGEGRHGGGAPVRRVPVAARSAPCAYPCPSDITQSSLGGVYSDRRQVPVFGNSKPEPVPVERRQQERLIVTMGKDWAPRGAGGRVRSAPCCVRGIEKQDRAAGEGHRSVPSHAPDLRSMRGRTGAEFCAQDTPPTKRGCQIVSRSVM